MLRTLLGVRDHAMVATLFYSGVRVSELAVWVDDVDLAANRIRVREEKGGKGRVLYLPPRLRPVLLEHYLAEIRPQLVGCVMGRVIRKRGTKNLYLDYFDASGQNRERATGTADETEAHRLLLEVAPQPVCEIPGGPAG